MTSLSRPGGNVTGVKLFRALLGNGSEATPILLDSELMPKDANHCFILGIRIGLTGEPEFGEVAGTLAHSLGRQIFILSAGSERELEPALASLAQHRLLSRCLVSGHSLFTVLCANALSS